MIYDSRARVCGRRVVQLNNDRTGGEGTTPGDAFALNFVKQHVGVHPPYGEENMYGQPTKGCHYNSNYRNRSRPEVGARRGGGGYLVGSFIVDRRRRRIFSIVQASCCSANRVHVLFCVFLPIVVPRTPVPFKKLSPWQHCLMAMHGPIFIFDAGIITVPCTPTIQQKLAPRRHRLKNSHVIDAYRLLTLVSSLYMHFLQRHAACAYCFLRWLPTFRQRQNAGDSYFPGLRPRV